MSHAPPPYDVDRVARVVGDAIGAIHSARSARGAGGLEGGAAGDTSPAAIRIRVRYYADMLALAGCDPRGLRVLDAGCGPGFGVVTLAAMGAAHVSGLELLADRAAATRANFADLPAEMRARVAIVEGDAVAMPLPDGAFDLIVSNEAVKSYLDVGRFCDEAARTLAPGGTLVVADRNNMRNPRLRRRTLDVWEAYEAGPAGSAVHGHEIDDPYVLQRERIVRAAFPAVSEEQARSLARQTFAMTREQVLAACERQLAGGPAPASAFRRGAVPVDPAGMKPEALVDPYELARELERAGLRARVHAYFGGADGRPAVRAAGRLLRSASRLTIAAAPAFRVTARKP